MMGMQKNKANFKTQRKGGGFSAIELLITATVLTIITGLGLMGITRARASVRLSGAAREYASYVEKARIFSIRRHADAASERANVAINANQISYDVTMDLDGDGGMDTRTIPLPEGVTFQTIETIAFDWRGRTWRTANGDTEQNAQVSIRMVGPNDTVTIDVTGSGDITINSEVFDDEVPDVSLKVGDLAAGATPVPAPGTIETTPEPPVTTPGTEPVPVTPPAPEVGGGVTLPTLPTIPTLPTTPGPPANPTPTPTPTPTPVPTPTPLVCTMTTDKALLIMHQDGTATIKVGVTSNGVVSITGSSSKPSDLQVTPGGTQIVGSGSFTTFTIKSKRSIGVYTVTLSSSCDTKVVPVTVLL